MKVSIICTVFNHDKYLRDTLDGFVKQKTSFPFEAIVHDDCSTDDSRRIIQEYADKYPQIIKPIYESENLFSHHDGSLRRAIETHVKGEYVAICEGDDFWTDPYKLHKQVDFLDNHPDYTLCFHDVEIKNETACKNLRPLYKSFVTGEYSADNIFLNHIPTCSAVMRAECYLSRPYNKNFVVGDNVMWMSCCAKGRAFCINEKMAVYRRTDSGWTSKTYNDYNKALAYFNKSFIHLDLLEKYFPGIASKGILKRRCSLMAKITILDIRNKKSKSLKDLINGIKGFKFGYIYQLFNQIFEGVGWKIRSKTQSHKKY